MYPSSSSSKNTDQYSSNHPSSSHHQLSSLPLHINSNQNNLYRASYYYPQPYDRSNHYPHTAYQYPPSYNHYHTNQAIYYTRYQTQPPIDSRPIDNTNGGAPHLISTQPDIQPPYDINQHPPTTTAHHYPTTTHRYPPTYQCLPHTYQYPPHTTYYASLYNRTHPPIDKYYSPKIQRQIEEANAKKRQQQQKKESKRQKTKEKLKKRAKSRQHRDDKSSTRNIGYDNERSLELLKELSSYYDYSSSSPKEGFGPFVIKCLEHGIDVYSSIFRNFDIPKKQEKINAFYSSVTTINKDSTQLANSYRSEFNSMNEEKLVLLELLKSQYNYEQHQTKEGFDEVLFQCCDCGLESRHMKWYLRLHDTYRTLPFIGKSKDDYLLNMLKGIIALTKEKTRIQLKRDKHLIVTRSIEDTLQMSADLFKQLDVNGKEGEPLDVAKRGLAELSEILCDDDDSHDDPFKFNFQD